MTSNMMMMKKKKKKLILKMQRKRANEMHACLVETKLAAVNKQDLSTAFFKSKGLIQWTL